MASDLVRDAGRATSSSGVLPQSDVLDTISRTRRSRIRQNDAKRRLEVNPRNLSEYPQPYAAEEGSDSHLSITSNCGSTLQESRLSLKSWIASASLEEPRVAVA